MVQRKELGGGGGVPTPAYVCMYLQLRVFFDFDILCDLSKKNTNNHTTRHISERQRVLWPAHIGRISQRIERP